MKKVRIFTLREKKRAGEKIAAITAHDAPSASLAETAGLDLILVGDSLGMTALGFPTTIHVTLEMTIHHCAAVGRGASLPFLVGDMPFMTYKVSAEQALTNAARIVQEGGMEAVKIEGGAEMAPTVGRLVQAGLPVMAHVGLTPQSYHAQGGYRVQGRGEEAADRLMADAKALEEAGAFCLVLELIPASVATRVTQALSIPTIGIGAGSGCDGQILVQSDVLGLSGRKPLKMVRQYANLHKDCVQALENYAREVRESKFPGPENVPEE